MFEEENVWRRAVEKPLRRVDKMKISLIARGRETKTNIKQNCWDKDYKSDL